MTPIVTVQMTWQTYEYPPRYLHQVPQQMLGNTARAGSAMLFQLLID